MYSSTECFFISLHDHNVYLYLLIVGTDGIYLPTAQITCGEEQLAPKIFWFYLHDPNVGQLLIVEVKDESQQQ